MEKVTLRSQGPRMAPPASLHPTQDTRIARTSAICAPAMCSPQRGDRLHPLLAGSRRLAGRGRRTIAQAGLAIGLASELLGVRLVRADRDGTVRLLSPTGACASNAGVWMTRVP
jgi:hypothetical protein